MDIAAIEKLLQTGHPKEAIQQCRAALEAGPSSSVLNLLGRALIADGDMNGAEEAFRAALSADAADHRPLANLGNIARQRGDREAAVELYRRALAVEPNAARTLTNLGGLLHELGQLDEARTLLERAHAIDPNHVATTVRLVRVVKALEGFGAAELVLREAVRRGPPSSLVEAELGWLCEGAGKLGEARAHLEEAHRLDPNSAPICAALGDLLRHAQEITRAKELFEKALAIDSKLMVAHLGLAFVFAGLGDTDSFERHYARAREVGPIPVDAQSTRLYYLLHDERQTAVSLAQAHCESARLLFSGTRRELPLAALTPPRKLRIGYVSPDFCNHVVALFIEGVIAAHDRTRFDIALVHTGRLKDEVTARFARLAPLHDFASLDDEAFVSSMRELELDVVVDLAGHTRGHRLAALARGVAPVQTTYLGYPSTTGLGSFDYRITDWVADPIGSESEFVEKLHRLPSIAWSYAPWADTLAPEPKTSNDIVFGCFNRREKIGPSLTQCFRRILESLPNARLVLKAKAFADRTVREDLSKRMGEHLADRVALEPWRSSPLDNYEAYRSIDVALDTYPYNGTTTTCDALWMGVPVVTMHGPTSASRVGRALLTAVGLESLAASTPDEYVAQALRIANDDAWRRDLRAHLRSRMSASPLGDPKRLASDLENAYFAMVSEKAALDSRERAPGDSVD